MLRTNTCGELTRNDLGKEVTLCGWVQKSRDLGGTTFIDVRDRYGITQLVFNDETAAVIKEQARTLGREFVIKVSGKVIERSNKNLKIHTGEIEIAATELEVLNSSKVPPFLIEDETDGGEELRAKYRYLDLRRNPIRNNLVLRHKMAQEVRKYLDGLDFIEVETPVLIKSTPEGARDFVVPSRMNQGEFYALPQSPQTFKQLLMVSGFDRYFQIVKCFRDEDLRADRQPEFTQIDCEMSFITQEDILNVFEGLVRTLFKNVKGIDLVDVPRMTYADAMRLYGSDKPDTRFEMQFVELKNETLPEEERSTLWKSTFDAENAGFGDINVIPQIRFNGFPIFEQAEFIAGINVKGIANYTRKQLDELTDWLKRPQIGATGLIYVLNFIIQMI